MYLPKSPYAYQWQNRPHIDGLPIMQLESAPPTESSTSQTKLNNMGLANSSLGNTAIDLLNCQIGGLLLLNSVAASQTYSGSQVPRVSQIAVLI